ncbi:hypothetical protein NL676_036407 [Syzygium grande]|nr:hypothetical protein NL676_036407 [Syzygium grande]
MRAGLSTIQQTLTPEAANVLSHSIAEAGRRNHSQTTPLHVASTLLGSPSGFLRQACIKSHPNSSHPLQCRALELCFSVALERLPTAQGGSPGLDPPISNALMAALKRAQAHQRRGCPEQQQQPLLAVKVELEQLIISILDDPSVSRVMREASFSSPAVKATIEQSLNSAAPAAANANSAPIGLGFRSPAVPAVAAPPRNLYLSPRLQQQQQQQQLGNSIQQRGEEVKRVVDVLLRPKKRNPVLVGESEPEAVVKELLKRVENKELGDGLLKNIQVAPLDNEIGSDEAKIPAKFQQLGDVLETKMGNSGGGGGVVLDLGDLKWLVEQPAAAHGSGTVQPQQQLVSNKGRIMVAEMAKLLSRFEKSSCRLWLIGTATCETYLRCQVYHPSMETEWDLQALSIAARAPHPGLFPRFGANGILGSSVESFSPLNNLPTTISAPPRRLSENLDPARRMGCCPECTQKCEQEIARAAATELEKPSPEVESESGRSPLPQWLQSAKVHESQNKFQTKDQGILQKQRSQEIQKKWKDMCLRSHPQLHQQIVGSDKISSVPRLIPGLCNPNPLLRQPFQPKLQLNRSLGEALQLNSSMPASQPPESVASPPRSPVRTDLALGPVKVAETTFETSNGDQLRDFLGIMSAEPQKKIAEVNIEKLLSKSDTDSYKKLLKGLLEKVWWQHDASSALATAMTQCKLGNSKRRGPGSKGDTWLLFIGPDRVGKRKMASALSNQVCGASPTVVSFGSRRSGGDSPTSFRGKTVLDRIAEAVRRNPSLVVLLEDIDEADVLVRGSIKRAMETGRIADSHGREISLGNVTIILTLHWSPDNQKLSSDGTSLDEEKLFRLARSGWQLRLSLCEKSAKRRASWLREQDRLTKPRKESSLGMGFDLNEAADVDDDRADGSHNSSDLTVDHDVDHGLDDRRSSTASLVYKELLKHVDDSIIFSPVDFDPVVQETTNSIKKTFSTVVGGRVSIEVQEEAIQKILGGVWLGQTGLEEWTENVLIPFFHQLRAQLPATVGMTPDESVLIRLESDGESDSPREGEWLPSSIKVVVDGL